MKEKNIINKTLLEESRKGRTLFRNNTGLAWQGVRFKTKNRNEILLKNPRPVKFGLCVGSSDIIGWTPVIISEKDIGKKIAVFTAIEIKTKKLKPTLAQINFISLVNESGGIGIIKYED